MKKLLFLYNLGITSLAWLPGHCADADDEHKLPPMPIAEFEQYMHKYIPREAEIQAYISSEIYDDIRKNKKGWHHHSELGWVLKNSIRQRGINNTLTFYRYESNGSRKIIDDFDTKAVRIQTYGDSFTHCDQVNDGETWQYYLSSHFREPVENFGVGGYSVYQAFLRYKQIQETDPAPYIILNIWTDDHFRNMDSWRSVRFGGPYAGGYTLPYVRANHKTQEIKTFANKCPTPQSLLRLRSMDFLREQFYDDEVCQLVLATKGGRNLRKAALPVATGLAQAEYSEDINEIIKDYVQNALYSSQRIVEWFEKETAARGQKFMLILSHSPEILTLELEGKPRWDQCFLDYLESKPYPIVDLRESHLEDFKKSKLSPQEYMDKFYIGHYAPEGNYFCAKALVEPLVKWLNPAPINYRK